MDRALLRLSLERWAESFSRIRSQLIDRNDFPRLPASDLALAISGVRRCGKTSLAMQISKIFNDSEVLYYNFEDPLFLDQTDPGGVDILFSIFEQIHGTTPRLIILDEVQNVPGWERWVRTAVDQKRSPIIVTGSNAKLLSADLSTSLTGRSLEYNAWPLSLSEFVQFTMRSHNEIFTNRDLIEEKRLRLHRIMEWGTLPAITLSQEDNQKELLLNQYLSDLVHKDIINRHNIRNKKALDQILTYYLTNFSSLHSFSSIKKAFNIPIDTASDYTEALKSAFLIFEVERYHKNLKVQSRDARKIYVVDAGLRRVAARSPQADIEKLLENIVFLELKRKKHTVHYYLEKGEVDFVITKNYEPQIAIQVCAYGMDNPKTREREISSLIDCMDDLNLQEGLIVTIDRDELIEVSNKKIRSVTAHSWLS